MVQFFESYVESVQFCVSNFLQKEVQFFEPLSKNMLNSLSHFFQKRFDSVGLVQKKNSILWVDTKRDDAVTLDIRDAFRSYSTTKQLYTTCGQDTTILKQRLKLKLTDRTSCVPIASSFVSRATRDRTRNLSVNCQRCHCVACGKKTDHIIKSWADFHCIATRTHWLLKSINSFTLKS